MTGNEKINRPCGKFLEYKVNGNSMRGKCPVLENQSLLLALSSGSNSYHLLDDRQ